MNYRYTLFLLSILFSSVLFTPAYGQIFFPLDAGFHICTQSASEWADLDGDGDLDAFLLGTDTLGLPSFHMYKNNGNGTFDVVNTTIGGLSKPACAVADFDNDGDTDLALSGYDGTNNVSILYRNDGGFVFAALNAGIAGLADGSIAFADFNNDTYPDLFISGENNNGYPLTYLYVNDDGSSFTLSDNIFKGFRRSSIACNDFDRDEDIDFAVCGLDSLGQTNTYIYINEDGLYSNMNAGIMPLQGGMLNWGDYNNDGYADLAIGGTASDNSSQTMVYTNNAGASFSPHPASFTGFSDGSVQWGDMDNNGTLDLIIGGVAYTSGNPPPPPAEDPYMIIYYNQGDDTFMGQAFDFEIPSHNDIALGDFDNDSDLDLFVTGTFVSPIGHGLSAYILRNDIGATNTPSSAPTNLDYEVNVNDIVFQWDEATGNTTPQGGLNYNLRIGTQADNMDVLSAMADLTDGYRYIVAQGNTGANTSITLGGMAFGTYYASVQAIDHTYAGSAFSTYIEVNYLPTAFFTIDDSACVNQYAEIIYEGNASSSAVNTWDLDGGSFSVGSGTGQGPGPHYANWTTAGLKTVTLIVTENGISSDSVSHQIMIIAPIVNQGLISGEDDICQGTASTTYTSTDIGGADYYLWRVDPIDAGNFTTNAQQTELSWDPDFHGTALITVEGVNFCGSGPVSDVLNVQVRPLPAKPETPTGPAALCKDPGTTSYSTAGVPGQTYVWELFPPGAGSISNNGTATATVNWESTFDGDAAIVVGAENTCGAGPLSDTLDVNVAVPPMADAGEDMTIPYLTDTVLDGSASGGSGSYSYLWSPAEFLIDPEVEDPQTVILENVTQFTLVVTDLESNCSDDDEVVITPEGGPLNVIVSADPMELCPGELVELEAYPGGGTTNYTYLWSSMPEGFYSTEKNTTAYPEVTTTYYVMVDDGNSTVEDSVIIVVNPLPGDANNIIGPEQVCKGAEGILFHTEEVPYAESYLWELDEGIFGSSDSTSILLSFALAPVSPTAEIKVTPLNECGEGMESTLMLTYIEPPSTPQGIIGPDSLCTTTDTIVTFSIEYPSADATTYEWKLTPAEAGYIVGDQENVSVHFKSNWEGMVTFNVRAVNACGTSDWSEQVIVHAFTCVGIIEPAGEGVSVIAYPNPAQDILNIAYEIKDRHGNLALGVWDLYGRKKKELILEPGNGKIQVNTSSFPAGIYIIQLYNEQGVMGTTKFLVGH